MRYKEVKSLAIDLKIEKEKKLSSEDIYDIVNFSIQASDLNGFVNSFIFNRALYLFSAIIFYPERKDEISKKISDNFSNAWDSLIEDGTIEQMLNDYSLDLENLAEIGQVWFDEFIAYRQSFRGILDDFQAISGNIVDVAAQQLRKAAEESGANNIIEIADKWGMNNTESLYKE